jgi:hypothetical protein
MLFGSNEICRLKFRFFDNVLVFIFCSIVGAAKCAVGRSQCIRNSFCTACMPSLILCDIPAHHAQENIIQCSEGIWKLDTARQMVRRIKRRAK